MSSLNFSFPGMTTTTLPIDDGAESNFIEQSADISFLDTVVLNQSTDEEKTEALPVSRILNYKDWLFSLIKSELTVRQWQIFELQIIYGYNYDEIAKILGLSHRMVVWTTMRRSIRRLRKKLGPMLECLLPRKGAICGN